MSEQNELESRISLGAFGSEFQEAILGHCLADAQFLAACKELVPPEWFTKQTCAEIIRMIYRVYDIKSQNGASKSLPTPQEVGSQITLDYPRVADKEERLVVLQSCIAKADAISIEFVRTHMTGWIRMIKLNNLLYDAGERFKKRKYDECIEWIDDKFFNLKETTFMKDERVRFDDIPGFIESQAASMNANCITFGNIEIDKLMRINSVMDYPAGCQVISKMTKGGGLPGDSTVIMGSTNSGKTSTIIAMIARNILMERHCLLINHEGKNDDMVWKILSVMTRRSVADISTKFTTDAELQACLRVVGNLCEKYLVYVPWIKPGHMFVEDVMQLIDSEQEKRLMLRGDGRGFDLVVDDYPAKLESKFMGGKAAIWDKRAYVYNQFYLSAEHHKFHGIFPVQTNRNGSRINRGDHDENRMLAMEDVAEGYGVIAQVPNVITINRSIWDKAHNTIRYFIAKSRSSSTDHTVVCGSQMNISVPFEFDSKTVIFMAWETMDNQFIIQKLGLPITGADSIADRQAVNQKRILENLNNKAQLPPPVFDLVTQQIQAQELARDSAPLTPGEPIPGDKTNTP